MMLHICLVFCFLAAATNAQEGSVRLVGGNSHIEGRVEVFYEGVWGTVCDDDWDLTDGHVVCRSLGLGPALEVFTHAHFGEGTGEIWLDNLACTEDDTSILTCVNAGEVGDHNCGHSEDAGVRCSTGVRLAGGENPEEGRVELFYVGSWGTVCDDLWDDVAADVVCRSLGSPSGVAGSGFGEGSGYILLDNVECSGTESSLWDCGSNDIFQNNCGHYEDAGVVCGPKMRLVNGLDSREGRLELFYDGAWGTVCDDSFDDTDAGVVCRYLGLSPDGTAFARSAFGEGTGRIILDDVTCEGGEFDLFACPNRGLLDHNCHHVEDAGVRCVPYVRLVGGASENEGRVEVYYQGQWGTVCDDGWDWLDSRVVCRMLALGSSGTMTSFGEGTGNIVLDNVQCVGDEMDLFSCPANNPLDHNCAHREDVGVTCTF